MGLRQSLAQFYSRTAGRPDKALPWLNKAVERARAEKSPRLPAMLASRVSCLLHPRVDDLPEARRSINELLSSFPDYLQGLILAAEVHARVGEIDQAIDRLDEFLRNRPDDNFARYQRALHRVGLGQLGAAVEDLEAIKHTDRLALELEPRLLLARLHRDAGRPKLWIRELESLVADAPDSARALEALLRAYVRDQRTEEAERTVTKWINRAPPKAKARALFTRSRILLQQGDEGKALADAKRADLLLEHSAEAVAKVLATYARLGRPGPGIDYYQRYAPKASPSAALISSYARLLAGADRHEEAVNQFRRAMRLGIDDSAAAMRVVTGNLRAAFASEEAATAAIALFRRECEAVVARANDRILLELHLVTGRQDEAIRKLEELIAGSSDDRRRARLLHKLGDLFQVAEQPRRARQSYEESLTYAPDSWIVLNNLGYLLSDRLHEHQRARDFAARAVSLAPNVATLDTLGWILVGLGEYRSAIAHLHRAVRTDPDHLLSRFHLGEAYRRNGQFDQASTVLGAGQDLARLVDDKDLVARFTTSLTRVAESDTAQ